MMSYKLLLAQYMVTIGFMIVPGDKLCPSCLKEINDLKLEVEEKQNLSMAEENKLIKKSEQDTSFEEERELLHETLTTLDVSQMKVHSLPKSSKLKRGKRKLR